MPYEFQASMMIQRIIGGCQRSTSLLAPGLPLKQEHVYKGLRISQFARLNANQSTLPTISVIDKSNKVYLHDVVKIIVNRDYDWR